MEKIKTFRDLKVWQKAHQLVLDIYKATHDYPSEEKFGITAQLRKSASSIPTNIVEGYKRHGRKEFLHFLNVADASLEETKYHALLSKDLGYLKEITFNRLMADCEEIGRMLDGLQKSLTD
jgi:four helix bundle protein